MIIRTIIEKEDLCEVANEVLEVLGYKNIPIEAIPPLQPIEDTISQLCESNKGEAAPPLLVAIPHLRLRDRVLYRDVSVFQALDALLKTRPMDALDQMTLTTSPVLEDKDDGVLLLWHLSEEEAATLLAAAKGVPQPLEDLTLPQLRSVELVGENMMHSAAILIARHLLKNGLFDECQLEFEAARRLAEAQYRALGYDNLQEEPYHTLYTSWDRYTALRAWQAYTAQRILRHYSKEE